MYGRIGLVITILALPGCGSLLTEATSTTAGITGTAAAAAVTHNATTAAAIGLGVDAVFREGLKYTERRVHQSEQDAIAQAAGPLPVNAVAPWAISHTIPIESDEHGEVVVSRAFGALGISCKEIVFSVDTEKKHGQRRLFYIATICQDGAVWRWASAEPSTHRWSGIQ